MDVTLDPIKVGVIGTGFGAKAHLPAFQAHPDFKPVAILAVRPERAEEMAQRFGLEWHGTDLERFLTEPDIDLVSIVSQPVLHYQQAKAVLDAGKHLLLEKPPAESVEQIEELHYLAQDRGIWAAVNFQFRNVCARRHATELLWEGAIGRLRHAEIRDFTDFWAAPDSKRTWSWQNTHETGGGVLGMFASHHIDWLRIMGGEWEYVDGEARVVVPRRKDSGGVWRECTAEDYVAISGMLEREVTTRIVVAACFHHREFSIRLFGEKGTIEIEGTGEGYGHERLYLRLSESERVAVDIDPALRIKPRLSDFRADLMMPHLDALAESIREDQETGYPTLEDGIAVQRVMDSVHLRG